MRILLLEDDDSISSCLRDLFCDKAHGHMCDEASTIAEASTLLSKYKYDIVLADLVINGEKCTAFLEEVRKLQPEAHLCLMSAWPGSKKLADDCKIGCFIPKPFDIDMIEEIFVKK